MRFARVLFTALAFGAFGAFGACAPQHHGHVVDPHARLAVGAESFVDDGPFRVVFGGPRGETSTPHEVTIAYSRPVRKIGMADDAVTTGPTPATVTTVSDKTKVDGSWRWFGERTAVFWPSDPFPNATELRVDIDPSLRAFDGSALTTPESFTFSTARPELQTATYQYEEEFDRHLVTVDFNQGITSDMVAREIRLEGKGPKGVVPIPFQVIDVYENNRFRLHANRVIAGLDEVTAIAAPTLRSSAGPLASNHETRIVMPEVGAFRAELSCADYDTEGTVTPSGQSQRCLPERAEVQIRLNKEVEPKDLLRHLVITPPVRIKLRPDQERLYSLSLNEVMELTAGRHYRVIVKAGLRASDHEVLAYDQVLDFDMADYAPTIGYRDLDRQAMVVESARPTVKLEMYTMNVPAFDAVRAPLDDATLFDLLLGGKATAARVRALPGSVTSHVDVKAKKNESGQTRFDLPASLRPAGKSGSFAIATSAKGLDDDVRVLSVTDLGISTKWSPHGALIWIKRFSTNAPVADAKVTLYRAWRPKQDDATPATPVALVASREAFTTQTDAQGLATIPEQVAATFLETDESRTDAVLFAQKDDDRAYSVLPQADPSLARVFGSLFTERAIYRPGDTGYIKGVFRAPTGHGLRALAGRAATVEGVDSEQHVLFTKTVTLDAFGAFDCEMPIPRTTRLGFSQVRARLGSGPIHLPKEGHFRYGREDPWSAHGHFLVDELRTIDFKVEVESNEPTFTRGDTAQITARGKYLLGAPMHRVPVMFGVRRERSSWTPPGLEKFNTDAYSVATGAALGPGPILDGMLKDDGSVTVPLSLALLGQEGPERLVIDAGIEDVSRAFAAGADTSIFVHPGDLYLGLRTTSQAWIGKTIHVELAASSITGIRKAGIHARIEMLRADAESRPAETDVACDVRTTSTVVTCDLPVRETGPHWLRAVALDSQGRSVSSASAFYVPTGPEPPPPPQQPEPPPPPPPPPAPPPLPFDQACRAPALKDDFQMLRIDGGMAWDTKYAVGQTVRACLRGSGDSLLTFEREGVLGHQVFALSQLGTVVDVPITPDFVPNMLVNLRAVNGRSAPFPSGSKPQADFGHPTAHGTGIDLHVPAPERKLEVTIETADEYRPGAEVSARVRVRDGAGHPALSQVTLWAIDEAIYDLRPFRVPDFDEINGERGEDVTDVDTRDQIFWEKVGMHTTKAPSLRQGATQTNGGMSVGRTVFRPTAWFLPNVITGPDGVATVKAKLPDNLTTWRVFAVAMTTTDGFGSALTTFHTNKPLMVRPTLPRFLRSGDHADATVIVDSLSKEPLTVKVSMRAFGSVATSGKLAEETLTLPPEGHVPVRFPLDARNAGRGSVIFRVASARGDLADEVTVDQEVTSPSTFETVVVSGESRARADEPLGDLSRARPDVGGFDYKLASTPVVGLSDSLAGLVEYPYGCTEQLTSRLVPLVRLRSLARELGVALPNDIDGSVRSSVASLLTHQRHDGGFGFWPASKKSEPALTVMALNALYASRANGYVVSQEPIDRAITYLDTHDSLDLGSRALLEDLFASPSSGAHPREKELRELAAFAEKDPTFPVFARALVAHALASVDRTLGLRVLGSVAGQMRVTGATATVPDEEHLQWRTHLSSDARTTAMVLRAYVALDPKNALVTKLVRGLLAQRKNGRWLTTQASAWALLALEEARPLYATSARGSTAHVLYDGKEIDRATFDSASAHLGTTGTISMERLLATPGATLSFTTEGGPLFYEGALRYARREPPKTPLEHGIHVAKTMRVMPRSADPADLAAGFRVGDYVEVGVMMTSPVARDLVVLDDPIPAGFEAVNESYANMDRQALHTDASDRVTHRELRDDRVVTFFDELPAGQHRTTYLLRVTSGGTFNVPPAKAECMYAPDVFGRTAATVIDARP